jgi:hypothetical protein
MPNLIKIRPIGADLFHADGQTDMTKLLVAFRSFTNAPRNCRIQTSWVVKNPPSLSRDKSYISAVRAHITLALSVTLLCISVHSILQTQSSNPVMCTEILQQTHVTLHIITECWVRGCCTVLQSTHVTCIGKIQLFELGNSLVQNVSSLLTKY